MLSDFFFQIASLKSLPRSGWKVNLNLEKSESVAEHSYMMSVMAMILSDIKNLETEKLNIMPHWTEGLQRYLMSLDKFV